MDDIERIRFFFVFFNDIINQLPVQVSDYTYEYADE